MNFLFVSQMRLGTRIAVTVLLALVLVQGLNAAVLFLLPGPEVRVFSLRWLAEQSRQICETLLQTPTSQREETIKQNFTSGDLEVRWYTALPANTPITLPSPGTTRFKATIAAALEGLATRAEISGLATRPNPLARADFRYVPSDEASVWPQGPIVGDLDIPIPGVFEIAIELSDRSWVLISAQPSGPPLGFVLGILGLAGVAIAVIAMLSAWTARRSLRPLLGLVASARSLGIAREPLPIETKTLREFEPIGRALNEMQERIRKFMADRTQMLASISHDLRTPLTSLRLDAENIDDKKLKTQMVSDIDELTAMVDATLKFTGEELTSEPRQCLDVAALTISVCDDLQDQGKVVSYHGPNHAASVCQPVAIKRAIVNVIDNAIKYGGQAIVTLMMDGDAIVINITDNGPGIPDALMQASFSPFRRLDPARNRKVGGVGLGLTIARDVFRAHSGDITLSNVAPTGLNVRMTLPAERLPEPRQHIDISEGLPPQVVLAI